jgi:hypothetical protein
VEAVTRRLDLLRMEGLGFSPSEITKELSEKHACSRRTVQNDIHNRQKWQSKLMALENPQQILLKLQNREEQIYQKAGYKYLTSQNENIQLGALKLMWEINRHRSEILETPNGKMEITQTEPFIIKMWRPELADTKTK